MYNISTRLDALNRQLSIISKLQKMEEECGVSACKKVNITQHSSKLIQESNNVRKIDISL